MKKKSTTTSIDEDASITQGDIDAGKLILRKREAGGRVVQPKKRVTLYLDAALVRQPISLRTCRDAHPRVECAKRTAAIAVAMARMSDKAIGDAGRVEHSETYGLSY
jgi:hypothetical protein